MAGSIPPDFFESTGSLKDGLDDIKIMQRLHVALAESSKWLTSLRQDL